MLSIIPSSRSSGIGHAFCENPILRKLTLTGSPEGGRTLLRQATDQGMKGAMEPGGNAPFMVFDDADLEAAVEGAILCTFRNTGQTCVCANRIYVQPGLCDASAETLSARIARMAVGDGPVDGTGPGPLAPLFRFETEDEAIAVATDTILVRAAEFYARDYARITRVQTGLEREGPHHKIEACLDMKYGWTGI